MADSAGSTTSPRGKGFSQLWTEARGAWKARAGRFAQNGATTEKVGEADNAAAAADNDDFEVVAIPSADAEARPLTGHLTLNDQSRPEVVLQELQGMVGYIHRWGQLYQYFSTLNVSLLREAFMNMVFDVPKVYVGVQDLTGIYRELKTRLEAVLAQREQIEREKLLGKLKSPMTTKIKSEVAKHRGSSNSAPDLWQDPKARENWEFIRKNTTKFIPDTPSLQFMINDPALWKDIFTIFSLGDHLYLPGRLKHLTFNVPEAYAGTAMARAYPQLQARITKMHASRKAHFDRVVAGDTKGPWRDEEASSNRAFLTWVGHYLACPKIQELQEMIESMADWPKMFDVFCQGNLAALSERFDKLRFERGDDYPHTNKAVYYRDCGNLIRKIIESRHEYAETQKRFNLARKQGNQAAKVLAPWQNPVAKEMNDLLKDSEGYLSATPLATLQRMVCGDMKAWHEIFPIFSRENWDALSDHLSQLNFTLPNKERGDEVQAMYDGYAQGLKVKLQGVLNARNNPELAWDFKDLQKNAIHAQVVAFCAEVNEAWDDPEGSVAKAKQREARLEEDHRKLVDELNEFILSPDAACAEEWQMPGATGSQ